MRTYNVGNTTRHISRHRLLSFSTWMRLTKSLFDSIPIFCSWMMWPLKSFWNKTFAVLLLPVRCFLLFSALPLADISLLYDYVYIRGCLYCLFFFFSFFLFFCYLDALCRFAAGPCREVKHVRCERVSTRSFLSGVVAINYGSSPWRLYITLTWLKAFFSVAAFRKIQKVSRNQELYSERKRWLKYIKLCLVGV